jgi:hypothetical protein
MVMGPARNGCHYFGLSLRLVGLSRFTQLQFEMLEVSVFIVTFIIIYMAKVEYLR